MPKTDLEIKDDVDNMHPNDLGIAKTTWNNSATEANKIKAENLLVAQHVIKKVIELTNFLADYKTKNNNDITDIDKTGFKTDGDGNLCLEGKNADGSLNPNMDSILLKFGDLEEGVLDTYAGTLEGMQFAISMLGTEANSIYDPLTSNGNLTKTRTEIALR